jgi:hypothetical protein
VHNDTLENWIPLGDKHRIAIHREEFLSSNPIEGLEGQVGCFPVRTARGLNGVFGDLEVCDELMELSKEALYKSDYDTDNLTDDLIKYLQGKGLEVLPVNLRGYSQGEWMDVLLWTNPDEYGTEDGQAIARKALSWVARDLGCWFRGDIYTLGVEELVIYTAPNGKTIERWETVSDVDTVYTNYFDSRPELDDILNRLEINPADYGVEDSSRLELVN